MEIDKLFSDKKYLENEINFFITKKHIMKISNNPELVNSHLKKQGIIWNFLNLTKNILNLMIGLL